MGWREEMRQVVFPDGRRMVGASFRGVPFFVEVEEYEGGRRVVEHEFPFADDPFGEDMGRAARRFRVDGYVIGSDYLAQRRALIEALERKGPGALILPYDGTRSAAAPRFTARVTNKQGGMAVFTIEFFETPAQPPAPSAIPDLGAEVDLAADESLLAVAAEFAADFDTSQTPSFAVASLSDALVAAADGVGEFLGPVVEATQEAARLDQEIRILTADAASLVRTPGEILGAFQATFASLAETVAGAPGSVLDAFVGMYSLDLGSAPSTATATRQREQANHSALTRALKRVMVIEAARMAPKVAFESHQQAATKAAEIAALIEEQSETASDATYPALVRLRTAVLRAVPGEAELARLTFVTRQVPIPALLLAYQLHGDVEGEADIIARNRIRHPGFVAGTLAVLVDE